MPSFSHCSGLVISPLFLAANIERAVALSASSRNYRAASREDSKKESGKRRGGRIEPPARDRIHGGRALPIGRRVCSPTIAAWLWNEYVLRFCDRHTYFEEAGAVLVLSAELE